MTAVFDAGRTQLLSPRAEQSVGLEASPARSVLSEISLECLSRREKLPQVNGSSSSNVVHDASQLEVYKQPTSILKPGNNSPQAIRARLKRRKRRRHVRFTVDTKSWDGISNAAGHADLDEILFRFFCIQSKINTVDILEWMERHVPRLQALSDLLLDLCNRLEKLQGKDTTIPCLPRGGGKVLKVHPTDLGSLYKLHKVVSASLATAKGKRKSLLGSSTKSRKLAKIGSIVKVKAV